MKKALMKTFDAPTFGAVDFSSEHAAGFDQVQSRGVIGARSGSRCVCHAFASCALSVRHRAVNSSLRRCISKASLTNVAAVTRTPAVEPREGGIP
jgi:hypothetical protein